MEKNKNKKSKKHHFFLWFLSAITIIFSLIVLSYWKTDFVSKTVEKYLNKTFAAQGTILYKGISGNLVNEFIISDIAVNLKNGDTFTAQKIRLRYNLFTIIFGELNVESVIIDSLSLRFKAQEIKTDKKQSTSSSSLFSFINKIYPQKILKSIPEFNLDVLKINNGYLSFEGEPFSYSGINFTISGKKDQSGFDALISHLSGHWLEKNIDITNANAALKITDKQIMINNFIIETRQSLAALNLKFSRGDTSKLYCKVDKFSFNFDEWGIQSFKKNKKAGYISGNFILDGDALNMQLKGKTKGRLSGYVLDNLRVDAGIKKDKIFFNTLDLKTGDQQASYRGYYGLNKEINGRLNFKKLNIKRILNKGFDTALNGFLEIAVNLKRKKKINGSFDLNINNSHIASLQIDSLRFAALLTNGIYSIIEPSFLKVARNSRFSVSGNIIDTTISLNLETKDNNLNALSGAAGIDSLYGIFSGKLNLNGPLFDPDFTAKVNMPEFIFKNIRFDSTNFDAKIKHLVTRKEGTAFFKIHNGKIYDLPVDDITINAKFKDGVYNFPVISFRSSDNYIDARLHYFIQKDTSGVIIDHFRGRYKNYWLENVEAIELYFTQNSVSLDNFHLIGPRNSTIRASGNYDRKSDESEIYLSLNKISLKPFENFYKNKFELEGVVNGSVDIINPLKNIELNTNIKVDSLRYNNVPIGDITSSFVYFNRNFYLNELILNYNESQLSVTGDLAFTFDSTKQFDVFRESKTNVKIDWKNINIGQYSPLWQKNDRIIGKTSGYFEIHGTVANPMIRHHITLSAFKYNNFNISSAELFAQYNRGYIIIDSLGLNLNGSDFDIKGWQAYHLDFMQPDSAFKDNQFNLFVQSSGDSLTFLKEINDQLYAVYGDYKLELNIGGTLERPGIESGYLELDKGEILLSRVFDPIEDVNIRFDIEDSLLTIKRFDGAATAPKDLIEKGWDWLINILPWTDDKEEKGIIDVTGSLALSDLFRPKYDLDIALRNFYIDYFLNNTRLVLNSNSLSIKGRDTLHIAGKIEISDGEYIVDMDQIKKNIFLSTASTEQSYPLIDEDLEISIPSDFIISSASMDLTNNFKIAINGDLHIIKPAGDENEQISGLIVTTSGKYAAWNQMFEINSGEILFDTPNTINPQISITATKVIKDQTFDLTISGRLDELEQRIKVTKDGRELNLSDADKLTMLTFGTDLSGLSSHADSTMKNMGGDIATRALLNVMERGAENLTGLDKISVSTDESLIDFQRMKLNNGLKDASISFGKFITGDLYLEYRTKFAENFPAPNIGWHAGNRIFLEYRLYKRLKIDSFYEATQAGKMKIQLGISWEYDF
jgi:hypothetical protein